MVTSSARQGPARRPYHSPARQRQAEQTRARIIASAREAFRTDGYAAATLEAIATAANVSVKTVEAVFGSKRGLLAAVVDPVATAGPPQDLVNSIGESQDPRLQLRLIAELTRRAFEASLPEFELMRGAAAVTPEVAAVAEQIGSRRRGRQALLVSRLGDSGLLRAGLQPDEATDILWALTSYDLFRALVTERRWPADRYQAWLAGTLADQLLGH